MNQMVKRNGKWIPMEIAIKMREGENTKEVTPIIEEATESVEENIEEIGVELPEEENKSNEKTLEELVKEYEEVSGKNVSIRFKKNREWLIENINKYNK